MPPPNDKESSNEDGGGLCDLLFHSVLPHKRAAVGGQRGRQLRFFQAPSQTTRGGHFASDAVRARRRRGNRCQAQGQSTAEASELRQKLLAATNAAEATAALARHSPIFLSSDNEHVLKTMPPDVFARDQVPGARLALRRATDVSAAARRHLHEELLLATLSRCVQRRPKGDGVAC